jgi:hypothetical protein
MLITNLAKANAKPAGFFCVRRRTLLVIAVAVFVFVVLFSFIGTDLLIKKAPASKPDLLVGVDVGYGGEEDIYRVAEAVAGYANLIILGSLDVTEDTPTLTRVCDYLYEKGFYFIIYIGFAKVDYIPPKGPEPNFFNATKDRWGNKFLGVYLFDEIGGKQLDAPEKPVLRSRIPETKMNERIYSYVSESYVVEVIGNSAITLQWYVPPFPYYYTSDYGLYWFDYVSGYNTVFAEFVGNNSRQVAISLCRGAAHTIGLDAGHTSGQDWGVIITWKYDSAPFLEDGNQLYEDMILAYDSGASYVVVFNSPDVQNATTPLGTLTTEHLDAMRRFWDYAKTNPRSTVDPANTAYVLPRDYGYGMRRPDDTIWGLWSADELSPKIWNDTTALLAEYGSRLDIVYETRLGSQVINLPYNRLIFWNGTIVEK